MAVAGFIEFVVAGMAYPVADHVEVHVTVVAHRGIVFAAPVAQHRFGEPPIAALRNKAPAVDPHTQRTAIFAVGELADSGLERLGVRGCAAGFKGHLDVVEGRVAHSRGPPSFGFWMRRAATVPGRTSPSPSRRLRSSPPLRNWPHRTARAAYCHCDCVWVRSVASSGDIGARRVGQRQIGRT